MDISKIWPGWTITERLGHGGFGHVYKAVCESTQAVAAVKVIPLPMNDDDIADHRAMGKSDREILAIWREDVEWYMNEIKVIQQLKGSANIVSIEDSAIPLLSFQASQLIDASVYQIREHRFGYLGASLLYAVMFDRRYSVLCICN